MQYKLSNVLIKTENAAKPHSQQSQHVYKYLLSKTPNQKILDFGCGKLRYSDILTKSSKSVTFADSEIQLSRIQVVRGVKTSVKEYINSNYPSSSYVPVEKIAELDEKFDLITCINVLSAIPCERKLKQAIKDIRQLLSSGGIAIFINQHKSSYFKKYEKGIKHLYGYLYKTRSNYSYYGLMTKDVVEKLLIENQLIIKRSWSVGEINFVEAACE